MKAQTGISENKASAIAEILNTWLADEYVLYTKTRYYHWNVTGMNFHELHIFFEKQYTLIDESIDEIAERVRAIGHFAVGTLTDFSKMTHLSENKEEKLSAPVMLAELLRDHEIIIRWLRSQIKEVDDKYEDAGTADFMTGKMEEHEKMAWMIRSYLC